MGARPLTGLRPRNRELLYLAAVGVLTGLGFASVYIARQSLVSWGSLGYALFFFALYLIAHVMARIAVPEADPYLLPMAGLLTAIGVTEIYRLGPDGAFKQGLWIVIGVGLFALALFGLRRDYRVLEDYKYLFGIGAIALLFLPRLPGIGTTVNGARLWVRVGPIEVQPGEFAKIFLIVFLAAYLREKREVLAQGRLKDMGPSSSSGAAACSCSSRPTTSALPFCTSGSSSRCSTWRPRGSRSSSSALCSSLAGGVGAYEKIPHVRERITIWLHPWTTAKLYCPTSGTYLRATELCELSARAVALLDREWRLRRHRAGQGHFSTTDGKALIPFVNSDFIYSALAQELGLIGAAALLLVFMLFVARGMKIALQGDDGFSKLLAAGLTFGFGLQTFIIVGGVLRLIPLTGITLPFVSYGGSSVVANFLLLAGSPARLEQGELDVNKQISRLAVVALALLAALVVATTYWQTWASAVSPRRQDNAIERVAQFRIRRGLIYASDGKTCSPQIARQARRADAVLPHGIRHTASPRRSSATRRRAARVPASSGSENAYLTASNANLGTIFDEAHRQPEGHDGHGNNLVLNINANAQQLAETDLAGKCGAAVVLNPKTGAVYVMASSPRTTRTRSSRLRATQASCARRARAQARRSSLLNRATPGPATRRARPSRR